MNANDLYTQYIEEKLTQDKINEVIVDFIRGTAIYSLNCISVFFEYLFASSEEKEAILASLLLALTLCDRCIKYLMLV